MRPLAVVVDIGETIRDDTNEFHSWADWLGVPRHTLSALIGATRARGGSTDDAFRLLVPEWDLEIERDRRRRAGIDESMAETDLYPDVRSGLSAVQTTGLWVAAAGNQSTRVGELLRSLQLPVDAVITSAELGMPKPDPRFFRAVASIAGCPPDRVLHVGDSWENDVVAAANSGFRTAFLRRGPWGHLDAGRPAVDGAPDLRLDSLDELAPSLALLDGPVLR